MALQKDLDFKGLVAQEDVSRRKLIDLTAFQRVVLDKMKVPLLGKTDVVFLAKKYIQTLANAVQYEQLFEDFDFLAKSSFGNITNHK